MCQIMNIEFFNGCLTFFFFSSYWLELTGDKCCMMKVVNDVSSEWDRVRQNKMFRNKRTFAGGYWQQQNHVLNCLK